MLNQKRIILILTLVLIAGTAGAVTWFKTNKRLANPGIKFSPNPKTVVVNIELPVQVLDFVSTNLPQEQVVLDYLPKDTSFAKRMYTAPDGFPVMANIILMGTDRTSIHKAEYCLTGSGYSMNKKEVVKIPIGGPQPYDLEVAKWAVSGNFEGPNGQKEKRQGLYVFWFVAEGQSTPNYQTYKLWMMRDLLRTFRLQRWAYVSYFAPCEPGGEDAAFQRLQRLIAVSVPEFQQPPRGVTAVAKQ